MEIQENEIFHLRIIETCLPLYKDGYYQHAALESMKQVEMALRERGIAPKDRFGIELVKWVMGSGEITLTVPLGDDFQEKARTLFKGAFGYYRNYAAHDGAKIDKTICFRIMVLSSELLDLVGASKRSFENIGGVNGMIKAGMFKNAEEFIDLLNFLNGQQIIEEDYSEYEMELEGRGFNGTQVEAMFDFGFIRLDEWKTAPDYKAGILDSTLVDQIELTHEGVRILEELNKV